MNLIIHFIIVIFNLKFIKVLFILIKYLLDFTNLYFNLYDYLFFLLAIFHFNIPILYYDYPLHIQLQNFLVKQNIYQYQLHQWFNLKNQIIINFSSIVLEDNDSIHHGMQSNNLLLRSMSLEFCNYLLSPLKILFLQILIPNTLSHYILLNIKFLYMGLNLIKLLLLIYIQASKVLDHF